MRKKKGPTTGKTGSSKDRGKYQAGFREHNEDTRRKHWFRVEEYLGMKNWQTSLYTSGLCTWHLKFPPQSWLNLELKPRGSASCMRNGPLEHYDIIPAVLTHESRTEHLEYQFASNTSWYPRLTLKPQEDHVPIEITLFFDIQWEWFRKDAGCQLSS